MLNPNYVRRNNRLKARLLMCSIHPPPIPKRIGSGLLSHLVKTKIERDHPNDFTTQKYVYEQEVEAYLYLKTVPPSKLKSKIQRDHPLDFSTQKYVYGQESDAKVYMESLSSPSPTPAPVNKENELYQLLGNKTFDTEKGVTEDAANLASLKTLLKSDVNIEVAESQTNSTPLVLAAMFNRPKAAQMLLEKGANPNTNNLHGHSALLYAAYHNNVKLAKLLIEHGADINHVDKRGANAAAIVQAKHGAAANEFSRLLLKK